jgi:hypothetical protein
MSIREQYTRHKYAPTKRDSTKVIRAPRIRRKKLYRIKARNTKDHTVFFSTRTKLPQVTIKRFATLKGLKIDRISH